MDEPGADDLPWWTADPRTVLEVDPAARERLHRRVRRSLRARGDWRLHADRAFDEVITACARPRGAGDGVWLTPRMHELYRTLHASGHAHTFEVWTEEGLAAGLV